VIQLRRQLTNFMEHVRWRSWLKHRATKVAGSIPDGVIGIFHWL